MIEAGTLLQNRYRVERQIGQGGMGAVFIATDERFGSTVAIKETLFLDEKFRKAFEREARLLNSLKHPCLPRVSDHFEEGNGQFLVMEYIEGDDLSEIMERDRKAFALKDVLVWADQLLDALEYLHAQEMPVIHRDIKPQNLKLTPRGQIILLDFGLAKGNVTNPESATAAKSIVGYSRNYASLEQIQGTGTDPRSDLYSLSATLYHLLTGVPPADALTRAMNVLSDKDDPLIPVHEVNGEIPESISEVLYKVMALNANQRPNSAKEMRAMLLESEQEAAGNFATGAERPLATNIFTQKTQISGEPAAVKQSDIQTEVLQADDLSKVTVLKPLVTESKAANLSPSISTTTETKSSKRGLAIGATLGTLLLAGCAFAALYIYKPEVFGSNSSTNDANIESVTTAVNKATENENVSNVNANENMNADLTNMGNTNISDSSTQSRETTRTETKQNETPKTDTKTTKNQTTETVTQERPNPTPTYPYIPNIVIPRFPDRGNISEQQRERQERRRQEMERRRQQRQQRQQQTLPHPSPY